MFDWRAPLFWLSFAVLAPLMLAQAAWTTRHAQRLPKAGGAIDGVAGADYDSTPLSLLFVGESPVAGVGCATMEQSVAAQTALELSRLTRRPVRWHAAGVNGIRIRQTIDRLLPRLPQEPFDYIVSVHGVNDTVGLTTVNEWRRHLHTLAAELHRRHGGWVFHSQLPPVHLFTALPQPLRAVVGLRARVLDRALVEHPGRGGTFQVLGFDYPVDPALLAEDGYHPSPAGHALWGKALARLIAS